MTKEEREDAINYFKDKLENEVYGAKYNKLAIEALEQDSIALERYEDLCGYFDDAKDILNSRDDFKIWLARVKCLIYKAEELYEMNKDLVEIWGMRKND